MESINFKCGGCLKSIEAPLNMAGQQIACIHCNQGIIVPEIMQNQPQDSSSPKRSFSFEMLILNGFSFLGALFSILFVIVGLGSGSDLGIIISILSVILFFIIIFAHKAIMLLKYISEK